MDADSLRPTRAVTSALSSAKADSRVAGRSPSWPNVHGWVGTATLKRVEKGSTSVSLGVWLALFERLGLLPAVTALQDPVAAALLDATRRQRGGRRSVPTDLDF